MPAKKAGRRNTNDTTFVQVYPENGVTPILFLTPDLESMNIL
jgi:hypothetical protein